MNSGRNGVKTGELAIPLALLINSNSCLAKL